MGIRKLNRWQAFAGHFGFSLLLGIAVFALFRFVWYPGGLFVLAGAGTLLLLVVGVDVVMGPLLTLIVFNPAKKSLIFDLFVIVTLQIAALGYGVWVMAQSRPVFLVGVNDIFILVSANDIDPDELARAETPEFRSLPWGRPKLVGALPPKDPVERENLVFQSLEGGADLHQLPRYYVPFAQMSDDMLARGKSLEAMPDDNEALRAALAAELKARNIDPSDALIYTLRARRGFGVLVLSRSTGLPLFTLAIDPEKKGSDTDPSGVTPAPPARTSPVVAT